MKTFVVYYFSFFIIFLIIIFLQNTYEEYQRKKNHQKFLKSKLQHINCPKCINDWTDQKIDMITKYKIYMVCEICDHEWYTTIA